MDPDPENDVDPLDPDPPKLLCYSPDSESAKYGAYHCSTPRVFRCLASMFVMLLNIF